MAKKLSNDRRSHPILPVTTEATQYRGQNTGRQPYPVALHRELEATPESFVTNQLWLLLGKSLNPGGSIFQLLEAVIVPPLFSLIFYKIKMRWCMKVLCEIQSTRQNSKLLWCYWSQPSTACIVSLTHLAPHQILLWLGWPTIPVCQEVSPFFTRESPASWRPFSPQQIRFLVALAIMKLLDKKDAGWC